MKKNHIFNIDDLYHTVYLEHLEKAEEIYNKKIKENLTYEELAKEFNLSKTTIKRYTQDYKIYIYILDKNFNKFKALSKKERIKLRKKIVTIDKQNNNILDIGKQIEDLKLSGISNKDIANRLNLSINRISNIYKKYKKLINDKEIKDELKFIEYN